MKNKWSTLLLVIMLAGGAYYFIKYQSTKYNRTIPPIEDTGQQTQGAPASTTDSTLQKFIFSKAVIIPKADNTIDVTIPNLSVTQNIDADYPAFYIITPTDVNKETNAFNTIRGSTLSFLLVVNPKYTKGMQVINFDGKIQTLVDVDTTGYLWHFSYHVPERAYADAWEYYNISVQPCADSACTKKDPNNLQQIGIEITNPLDSKSQGTSTYIAHNVLGIQGFSINYPEELKYDIAYDSQHRLDTIDFYDPLDSTNGTHSSIVVIYEPDQYEKDHRSEANEMDFFEGDGLETKADGTTWGSYHSGAGNNGDPTTFIRKGPLGVEITQFSYFGNGGGQTELGPLYRSLFIDENTLKFIEN